MRITIVTLGTRGDVQPYVALGLGLQQAGHTVRLATHARFAPFVAEYGLPFHGLPVDPQAVLAPENDRAWLHPATNTVRNVWKIVTTVGPQVAALMRACLAACDGAEVVMGSVLGSLIALHVAEKLAVPFYPAYVQLVVPSGAHPSQLAPMLPLGPLYNRLSFNLFDRPAWLATRPFLNAGRRAALALPPVGHRSYPLAWLCQQGQPHLLGLSETVVPRPAEWGVWLHVTGYWFLDRPESWQPPADLVDFLQAGPPPVVVGFGSITVRDPEEATALVVESLRRARQRGILLTGWGGLSQADLPDDVFKLEAVPHDWLFPRAAAVVHHGGAGTTAAALRAGVPSVVVPNFMDQPFWAQRVVALGAGPRAIPRNRLSAARLSAAMCEAVEDERYRARAAAVGRCLRAENGVGRAVQAFERYPARVL